MEPSLSQLLEEKGIALERLVELTASLDGESQSARALLMETG